MAEEYERQDVVWRPISELMKLHNNPRTITKAEMDKLVRSIKRNKKFFSANPLILSDRTGELVIIGGNQRLEAAKIIGLEKVPTILMHNPTEREERETVILDNHSNGEYDMDILADEYGDLDLPELMGNEYPSDLFEEEKEIVEDEVPEAPEEPKAKLGDIYQLGEHRLMCGDSTKKEDIETLMGGVQADMLFTDPPYNVAFNGRSGNFEVIENDNLSDKDFESFINSTIDIIKHINLKIYYIWCNWKFYGILQNRLDYKSCIVWAKNVFGLGKGYRHQHEFCLFNGEIDEGINDETDLWEITKDSKYVHPTQKPVSLCARALKNHKSVSNVLDLFGGSGSTLIACEQLNRKCYMMELDPHYVDVIIQRWENFTGKKAVLLEGVNNA